MNLLKLFFARTLGVNPILIILPMLADDAAAMSEGAPSSPNTVDVDDVDVTVDPERLEYLRRATIVHRTSEMLNDQMEELETLCRGSLPPAVA